MAQESRTKKTLLNVRMNMLCYMASLVTAFFTRKILLDNLGAEFIGLTGTLGGLLGFLNLAELGVGSAIAYVLYKPIFDKDRLKINEVISVLGYLYRIIGLVIFGAGTILSLFLPLIFPNTGISLGAIYVGFYAYLATSMIGYFVNYRASLLSADQRNYIVTGYFQISTTTKVIVQMVAALLWTNFYLYFAIEFTFGIINSIILNWKIRQTYPWLRTEIREGHRLLKKYPEVARYIKQLFVQKLGGFAQGQTVPFLIYAFVSLPVVALYENYTMIMNRLMGVVSGIFNSMDASIGNLVAEGDKKRIYDTYCEIFAIQILISAILCGCLFQLISPFITVWLGREYVLSSLVVLMAVTRCFMSMMRSVTDGFLFAHGLFYDVWASFAEAFISLSVACIAGARWGLIGVISGTFTSTLLIVYIWKPYFLYSKGFKKSFIHYILNFSRHLLPLIVAYLAARQTFYLVFSYEMQSSSWLYWTLGAALFTLIMTIYATMLLYIASPGLRRCIHRFIHRQ